MFVIGFVVFGLCVVVIFVFDFVFVVFGVGVKDVINVDFIL